MWPPNVNSSGGWHQGQPDVALTQTIADMKYVAERNCIGIYSDSVWEHWGTQGPLYYVMGQLAWDPSRDGQAILDDYYERGFGPAAAQIKAYWRLMETTRNRCVASDKPRWAFYDKAFFAEASNLLDEAERVLADEPTVYAKRVDFVREGLKWTGFIIELRKTIATMKQRGQRIPELDAKARMLREQMEQLANSSPAINWSPLRPHTPRRRSTRPAACQKTRERSGSLEAVSCNR